MAQAGIRVLKQGEPVVGANVIIGEVLKDATTNAQGRITKTVPDDWGPIAVQIIIEGDGFSFGGGPYKIVRDIELVINI